MMSSFLNIEKLILIGFRKNYTIDFNPGVNIIYGDSDTGKSSILEFINYLLGGSSIELAEEISASVKYAALEVKINDVLYTIKRDIYNSNELIEVYQCEFNECLNQCPDKYSPNYSITKAPNGFFSDFLLDSLNFPKVKIKVSPSKENSSLKRLGFRSLFKYCYISQDDVGSKSFMDMGNWSKAATNREVFKYIFNVLDTSISELESEISFKANERNRVKQKYSVVSEFLRETDYESLISIDESIDEIDLNLNDLNIELASLNETMVANSENYSGIKSIFNELLLKEKHATEKIRSIEEQIDKYSRLKNDYENDIDKIKGLIVAKERIGDESIKSSPCPICDSLITIDENEVPFYIEPIQALTNELNYLPKRKNNINDLIGIQLSGYRELVQGRILFQNDLEKARKMLDTESEEMITPYLTQRDTLVKEISAQTQARESHVSNLRIRNQQEKIQKSYEILDGSITELQDQLKRLKDDAPDLQVVVNRVGDHLNKYLKYININNRYGVSISDKTLLPIVRDKDYFKITSGGLRTITSIGYMLAILEYSIESDINHPMFIMIDTVGKYLGKTEVKRYIDDTDRDEDIKEGMTDPNKYKNIYERIIDISTIAEDKGKSCQVILVDNDVPESFLENYKGYIVAHYSSTSEYGNATGLIDDMDDSVKLSEVERQMIVEALKNARRSVENTAKLLGISQAELRIRLKKLDIKEQ